MLVVPGHDFVLGRVSGSSFRLGRSRQCRAANEHADQPGEVESGQVISGQVRSDQVRLAGPERGGKKVEGERKGKT
jgi:hypothetical protein